MGSGFRWSVTWADGVPPRGRPGRVPSPAPALAPRVWPRPSPALGPIHPPASAIVSLGPCPSPAMTSVGPPCLGLFDPPPLAPFTLSPVPLDPLASGLYLLRSLARCLEEMRGLNEPPPLPPLAPPSPQLPPSPPLPQWSHSGTTERHQRLLWLAFLAAECVPWRGAPGRQPVVSGKEVRGPSPALSPPMPGQKPTFQTQNPLLSLVDHLREPTPCWMYQVHVTSLLIATWETCWLPRCMCSLWSSTFGAASRLGSSSVMRNRFAVQLQLELLHLLYDNRRRHPAMSSGARGRQVTAPRHTE